MASAYNRYSLARLGQDPAKKEIMTYIGGIIIAAFSITSGAFLIDDQRKLTDLDKDKANVTNFWLGSIQVVIGALVVLYLIFRFFTS